MSFLSNVVCTNLDKHLFVQYIYFQVFRKGFLKAVYIFVTRALISICIFLLFHHSLVKEIKQWK